MIPTEKELIEFVKARKLVNLSMIARFYNLKNNTASDLVNDLVKRKVVEIVKLGGSKVVLVK
ncbi:MAG TPA: hypothetical protein VJB94_05630 [Candidatus Nanoarchaeia archaeon]|nr:hypothetical protein [Candidatus Nanoarchaeia archaeon]